MGAGPHAHQQQHSSDVSRIGSAFLLNLLFTVAELMGGLDTAAVAGERGVRVD